MKKYHRWMILSASVVINLCNGVGYVWSVFSEPLKNLFGWTPEQLALAFTINMGMISPFGYLASARLQKWKGAKFTIVLGSLMTASGLFLTSFVSDIWLLYLTYGVVAGFGFNVAFGAILANTVKFFPDRKGLSLGMVIAGFGSGAVIIAPIASALIGNPDIGVMNAFRYLGISLFLVILVCTIWIEDAPADYLPDGWSASGAPASNAGGSRSPSAAAAARVFSGDLSWREMLSTWKFYLIVLLFITASFTGLTVVSSASPMSQKMYQLSPQVAALIVGLISACNALGRIGGGALNDKLGNVNVLILIFGVSILSLISLIAWKSTPVFVAAMIGIGAAYGACMVSFPAIVSSRFGTVNFIQNYGVTFFSYSIASFAAPRIAASIRVANNGDYTAAFGVAAAVATFGLALSFLFRHTEARKGRRTE